jgi:hypothetical protein
MNKEKAAGRRWNAAVKKRKLNYRFHNPNPAVATADYILKILIEANSQKVEKALQRTTEQLNAQIEEEGHSE